MPAMKPNYGPADWEPSPFAGRLYRQDLHIGLPIAPPGWNRNYNNPLENPQAFAQGTAVPQAGWNEWSLFPGRERG